MSDSSQNLKTIKDFFVLIAAIVIFAIVGVIIAKWQYDTTSHAPDGYRSSIYTVPGDVGSYDSFKTTQTPYNNPHNMPVFSEIVLADSDSEMEMITNYALIGGLIGFGLGVLNTFFQKKKSA